MKKTFEDLIKEITKDLLSLNRDELVSRIDECRNGEFFHIINDGGFLKYRENEFSDTLDISHSFTEEFNPIKKLSFLLNNDVPTWSTVKTVALLENKENTKPTKFNIDQELPWAA